METIDRDALVAAHGTDVIDAHGERIGSIEDIYYDDATGRAEWVGIGTGIFGLRRRAVPVEGARFDGDRLRVPYAKEQVKDAPGIDVDEISLEQERELQRYYGAAAGTAVGQDAGTALGAGAGSETGEGSMVRSEEELRVGTREAEAGRVRLRKWVETEPVEETVELRRETAHVRREPIEQAAPGAVLGEDEVEMTLHEERPVVEKETVARERVSLDRDTETQQETVSDELRRERVELEGDDAPTRDRGDDLPR